MYDLKYEILNSICLKYNLAKTELSCGTNCNVEPPAMKFKCPNCEEFTPIQRLKNPYYNNLSVERLMNIVMDLTDDSLEITKLADGYTVLVNQDSIVDYSAERESLELCLLDILFQLYLPTYVLDEMFRLK